MGLQVIFTYVFMGVRVYVCVDVLVYYYYFFFDLSFQQGQTLSA